MIEYNYLLNDITTNTSSVVSFELFCFVVIAFLLSLVIDIIFGELPTRIHPVVLVGSLINFFKNVFIKTHIFHITYIPIRYVSIKFNSNSFI